MAVNAYVEHVAVRVKDIHWHIRFFGQVLGMTMREAVEKAAAVQLRPMLMTILLALLGLIPATLASGVGSDVQRPLATVIVGGLASALLLVLTSTPEAVERLQRAGIEVSGPFTDAEVIALASGLDALPEMPDHYLERIMMAVEDRPDTVLGRRA